MHTFLAAFLGVFAIWLLVIILGAICLAVALYRDTEDRTRTVIHIMIVITLTGALFGLGMWG